VHRTEIKVTRSLAPHKEQNKREHKLTSQEHSHSLLGTAGGEIELELCVKEYFKKHTFGKEKMKKTQNRNTYLAIASERCEGKTDLNGVLKNDIDKENSVIKKILKRKHERKKKDITKNCTTYLAIASARREGKTSLKTTAAAAMTCQTTTMTTTTTTMTTVTVTTVMTVVLRRCYYHRRHHQQHHHHHHYRRHCFCHWSFQCRRRCHCRRRYCHCRCRQRAVDFRPRSSSSELQSCHSRSDAVSLYQPYP
jgi:hypothetical protein